MSERSQQERNDELIDLAYAEAVEVCSEAEGFGGMYDWQLPSNEEFRRRVRERRERLYRQKAKRATNA